MKFSCKLPVVLVTSVFALIGTSNASQYSPDYIIVGAGGAGLQLALYFEQFGLSYEVLEKESKVGSHFSKFPRFDELISINKWHRDKAQRLRYDWHTLLEAPFPMYEMTKDYFPKGLDWHHYMTRVAEEAGIMNKIHFGAQVERVMNDGTPCLGLADGTKRCANKRIFIGTGLEPKDEKLLEALGGIPYSKATKDMAIQRRVCILGNGNSGFEVAQNVFDVADRVSIYGRHAARLSSVTRYTGDVRVKYLQVLENLNMKLLDTVDSFSTKPSRVKGLEDVLTPAEMEQVDSIVRVAQWLKAARCETFFITTGFQSRIPEGLTMGSRFPVSTDWYQSPDNPTIHYIGWLMHEYDFQRSAGGFLSGFRYLIRNLAYHVRAEDTSEPYPVITLTKEEAIRKTISRFQVADDLFILQDGVAIRDVIAPIPEQPGTYHYYEGITHQFHRDLMARDDVISIYFAWGNGRTVNNVFDGMIRYNDTKRLINVLLHPVVEVGGMVRGVMEDVELEWIDGFESAIELAIRSAIEGNLRNFIAKEVYPYKQSNMNQTDYNYYQVPASNSTATDVDEGLMQTIWKAVYTDGREKEMEDLSKAARTWLPSLFEGTDDCCSEKKVQ